VRRILAITLGFLVLCRCADAQKAYPDAPPVIITRVAQVVTDIGTLLKAGQSSDKAVSPLGAAWDQLFFYTVADAIAPDNAEISVRTLKAAQYLGETARTDKQVSAVSSATASTTLAEKPGLVTFLSYAVEHGAIAQAVNGTSLTLTTSPYSLLILGTGGDTSENYDNLAFWRRFNLAASFNMTDQSNVLSNATAKQLSDYSAKMSLIGDRSTRSAKFRGIWNKSFAPVIQRRLNALTKGQVAILDELAESNPAFLDKSDSVRHQLLQDIANALKGKAELTKADTQSVTDEILAALHEGVYQPVKTGAVDVPKDTRDFINTNVIPALASAHDDLIAAKKNLSAAIDQFSKRPLLTFEYTGHRNVMQSGYAEFKLLYDQHVAPMDVVMNAGFSTYNTPNPVLHQGRIREYHGNLELEGQAKNPFPVTERDSGKMMYSVSAQLERFEEKGTNIAVANLRVELPIAAAVSIPLSVSYANKTELLNEKEIKGHFGLTFDLDKLYALTRSIGK
jgi:hypothetical protein